MATFFHLTDTFNGQVMAKGAGRFYTVFTSEGGFLGWVSGGNRDFRFFAEGGFEWGPSGRTRQAAVDAYYARKAKENAARKWREQQVPTSVFTVRLTPDNLHEAVEHLRGSLLEGAEDLGEVVNVRLTFDGHQNAMVIGANGRDVLGLPSTITAYKLA